MKLIALILGLVLQRLVARALHLRERQWFDSYFDIGLIRLRGANVLLVYLGSIVLLLVPAIPVFWANGMLISAGILWDLPYLLFAVLVVFFCLGPKDLSSEVDEYCVTLAGSDDAGVERILTEFFGVERSKVHEMGAVEEVIFVQATNRYFGVVFWFVVLGPVGAWLFRISDLLRRRVVSIARGDPESVRLTLSVVNVIHGVLSWIPARLAIIGYALSGNFDDAFNCWRSYQSKSDLPFHRGNDEVVACVGKAAMPDPIVDGPEEPIAAPHRAMQLINRALFVWIAVIAAMTLYGWTV